MSDGKLRLTSLFLVLIFLLLGRLVIIYQSSIFEKLGSPNGLLIALWLIPASTAFLISRFSEEHAAIKSLSLILIIPSLGSILNYLLGTLGEITDFRGTSGIWPTFQAYLFLSAIFIVPGTLAGRIASKGK